MANFSDVAKAAWQTDDGKTTFCVPMASVIHGFIYNKDAFDKLGLTPPKTEAEFFAAARQDQGRRHLCAARHGHARPVGSGHHGLREYRPELLEGRGRPQGADRRQGEADRSRMGQAVRGAGQMGALHGRRLQGPDLSRQPEPVHARPRRDLSGRLLGDLRVQAPGRFQDGRLSAAAAQGRRHLLHLRPARPCAGA